MSRSLILPLGDLLLAGARDVPEPALLDLQRQDDVLADGEILDDPLALPVSGQSPIRTGGPGAGC